MLLERVISVIVRRNTPNLPSQGSRTRILLLTLFFSTGKRQMCWQLLPSISAPYSLSKVKLIKSLLKGSSGSCDNYYRLGCVIIYVILWAHRAAATLTGSIPALVFHKNLIHHTRQAWLRLMRQKSACLQGCSFIGIMHTWWDGSWDWRVGMEGHRLFRKDRQGTWGGTVTLYANDQLECTELSHEPQMRSHPRTQGSGLKGRQVTL